MSHGGRGARRTRRRVIALVGDVRDADGNIAELITVAKYWRSWSDHRWIVRMFHN
jgi:pyruvate dehydrogenase (quinone)